MLLALLMTVLVRAVTISPPLSAFVQVEKPWIEQIRGSLQQSPVYLGKSPRELQFSATSPELGELCEVPRPFKVIGEKRLNEIYSSHISWEFKSVTIELWPIYSQTSGERCD